MRTGKSVTLAGLAGLLGLGAVITLGLRGQTRSAQTPPNTAGLALPLAGNAAFSATVATAFGGTPSGFQQITMIGDVDGREENVANHAMLIFDPNAGMPVDHKAAVKAAEIPFNVSGAVTTRVAISEHTIANGFGENIFYWGDAVGNVTVGWGDATHNGTVQPGNNFTINLPTSLNAFGALDSGSIIVITGLAVSPVADLSSFANVNGSYASYSGRIGEILYVTFTDTTGGLRLASSGQIVRSGLLAHPVADMVSGATAPPGIVSPSGFPVQVGAAFGVVFSAFSNLAGVAVDDDGSVYFQQVDLIGKTGANIVKAARVGTNHDGDRRDRDVYHAQPGRRRVRHDFGTGLTGGPIDQLLGNVDVVRQYRGDRERTWQRAVRGGGAIVQSGGSDRDQKHGGSLSESATNGADTLDDYHVRGRARRQ